MLGARHGRRRVLVTLVASDSVCAFGWLLGVANVFRDHVKERRGSCAWLASLVALGRLLVWFLVARLFLTRSEFEKRMQHIPIPTPGVKEKELRL